MRYIVLFLCVLVGSVAYAEPQIVVDPVAKTIKVVDNESTTPTTESTDQPTTESQVATGATTEESTQEPNKTTTPTATTTTGATQTGDVLTEFDRALGWMYTNGLTRYDTVSGYKPTNNLTREQFAKMVRQFYVTMGYDTSTKNTACDFADLGSADPTLIPHIKETCRLGIFRGSGGRFYPFKTITKAEVFAVLLRVYNQKKLDETISPWWQEYHQQASDLGVTDELQSTMMGAADRGSIALYVWRLRQIIVKDKEQSTGSTVTKDNDPDNNLEQAVGSSTRIDRDVVLVEAIHSMYEDGMISFDEWDDTQLYQPIRRGKVAAMLDVFGKKYVSNYRQKDIPSSCDFADIRDLESATQASIKRLCAMGVMKGDSVSGNFFPDSVMTKAQFVTTVVRMIDGMQDESSSPWWDTYYQRALQRKLISPQDKTSFEREMTQIEVIGFVHKLKIHALLGDSSRDGLLTNQFVRVIENKQNIIRAYVDSNFLRTIDNKVGYVTLDTDVRYKVIRNHIQEYSNGRLAWYGTMYDQTSNKEVGSVWFLTQKGRVIEGTIRLMETKQFYTITPDAQSYYRYTIVKAAR